MAQIVLLVVTYMAKQTIKTTKSRTRKTGGSSGYVKCNMCGGTGRHKAPKKKKKK